MHLLSIWITVIMYSAAMFCANAQQSFKLSGRVIADDLSPMQGAGVYVAQFSTGSVTDSSGRFSVEVKAGLSEVSFSYVGYVSEKIMLNIQRDTIIEVKMKTDLLLREVMVVDYKQMLSSLHEANGTISLTRENFTSLPAFMGEHDPIHAVQMQPGVQSGNEGARGIFIRGGSPDQNLMLLDGAPVYNPSHVYGFISVFNGDAIDKLNVYKDHYPAKYGGRLCSVLDVNIDEGNSDKVKGSISLGLVTSRFNINGPLTKKKKTTFALSGRGCYVGLYSAPISKRQYAKSGYDGTIYYYFGDVNAKVVHRFSDRTKAEINFFTNNDFYLFKRNLTNATLVYTEEGKLMQKLHWANYVASVGLTHAFNEDWQLKQTLYLSRYVINTKELDSYRQNNIQQGFEFYSISEGNTKSFINDIGWRADAVYNTNRQTFAMGGGITGLTYQTGKGSYDYESSYWPSEKLILDGTRIKAIEAFAYAEDEYRPDEYWLISGGFHTRIYHVEQKTFISFLPRVNVVYNPIAKFYLRASGSGLSQNMHLLATASSNILNDYWVPATDKAKPETGWNFSAGMTHKLPRNFEWSIDGFFRLTNNLIEYKGGSNNASVYRPWQTQIETGGKGRSYGAEFYFARTKGKVTGSVAYTLGWSQRKFQSLNQGEYFPYKYDRRHNLAAQLTVIIGRHFELGAAYVYGSGNMFTVSLQDYQSWGSVNNFNQQLGSYPGSTNGYVETISVSGGRNNYRLPSYQHLDVSFTYRKQKKNLEHAFNISVYNVYNHFNIFSVYSDSRTNPDGTRTVTFKKLSLFPVMPSLSYTLKFT